MRQTKHAKQQRLEPLTALSAGQPLESSMRAVLEPRFSHDLSRVRIHAGDAARDLSHALGARAFTVGSEIGLRDEADLMTEVLPHELAHAVQFERSGSSAPQQRVSHSSDAAELEAHQASASVMAGGQAQILAAPSAAVSLWPEWLSSAGSAVTGFLGGGTAPPQQAAPVAAPPAATPVAAPLAVSTPAITVTAPVTVAASTSGALPAAPGADAATPPAPINQQAMDQAAGALFRAMDGIGTDEDAIHAALNGRSPAEAAAIRAAYLEHYGANLDVDLGDELSGTELEAAQAAMTGDPVQAAATALVNAADGIGTNEEVIQRTLRGISDPAQRALVEAEFTRRTHGESLQTMLDDELSDSDLTISSALRTGDTAGADALALEAAMHDTTLGIDFGTDEDRVNRILEGSDAPGLAGVTDRRERERIQDAHRASVMAQYDARAAPGHTLQADLSDELSGAELTVSQRLSAGDRIGASAARMAVAADGIGTDEDGIYAQLEGRSGPERQAVIDRFNQDHGNQAGAFQAMVADEMSGLEAQRGSGAHLTEEGRLDPVFALQFAQDGVGTDEEMIRAALQDPTRPGQLLSQDQIRDLQARYADATGENLSTTLDSELSGRDSHDISQLMLGEPANVEERLARAEADWQFERGTGAGVMGSFTDVFYDSGNQLDAQHNHLTQMRTQLEMASPTERAALEAQAMRTLGFQQTDIGNFRAAQDSVSDKTAQAAALVAAAAFTIATGGAGSPALVGVMGMGTTGAAVAGGALAAGAGGLATMAAHRAIGGSSYGMEAFGTDAAMMGAGMVSGGLMSSPIFQGAAGGGTSILQNSLRSGMGVAEGGAAEFVLERGTQALVSTAIGGTTQASLNESVWRGPGNGAAIFGASMGTSFAGNLASGMAGGHSGSFAETRFGSGYGGAFARGALGDVGGGVASALVNPATYAGRWEDVALRVGTSAATNSVQGGLSGVGSLYGSRAYPRGGPAPTSSEPTSSEPIPTEPPGPPPPPGAATEIAPNRPPPPPGGEVTSAPPASDFEQMIHQAIAQETAGLAPLGAEPLNPNDFAPLSAPRASAVGFDDEPTLVTQRPTPSSESEAVTQVNQPAFDPEVTRVYTAAEMAAVMGQDRQIGIQDAADAFVAKNGDNVENFAGLSRDGRYGLASDFNEQLQAHFTAQHEGGAPPESPDLTFMHDTSRRETGMAHMDRNAIELNPASPHTATPTGAEDTGLLGTLGHEFGHIQQARQIANPDGFINPAYGREMDANNRAYISPDADYPGYRAQPMEVDARSWGSDSNAAIERALEQRRQSAVTQEMPAVSMAEPITQPMPAVTRRDLEPVTERIPTGAVDFDDEPTLVTNLNGRASRAAPTDDQIADQVMREGREHRGDDIRADARELKRDQIVEEMHSGIRSPETQMLEDDIGRDRLMSFADGEIGYSEAGVEVHHKTMLSEAPELGDRLENLEALEKNAHRRGFHDGDFRQQRGGIPGNPDFDEDSGFTGIGDARPLNPREIEAGMDAQSVDQWRELEGLRDRLEGREPPPVGRERERIGRGGSRLSDEERALREQSKQDSGILAEYERLARTDPSIAAVLETLREMMGAGE